MSTEYHIVTLDEFDPSKVAFGKPKSNTHGGKFIPLNYEGKRLYLKLPKLPAPFGLGTGQEDKEKFNVQLALEDTPAGKLLREKAAEFDEHILKTAEKNQCEWLGASKTKQMSRELIEDKYSNMLKFPKKAGSTEINPDYPPFIRIQLPRTASTKAEDNDDQPSKEGVFRTELFDNKNNPIDISFDTIPSRCELSSLLYATSIWSSKTGFGVSWRAQQLKVFPRPGLPKGRCLIEDPEEDDLENQENSENQENDVEDVEETEEVEDVEDVEEAEDDDVEDVEEESEPEPEPEPPKTKAKTSAKKTVKK